MSKKRKEKERLFKHARFWQRFGFYYFFLLPLRNRWLDVIQITFANR